MKMKQPLFSTLFVLVLTAATTLAQRYDITQGTITFSKIGDDLHVLQGATDDKYVFNNDTFSNILIYGNSTVTENVIVIDTPWTSSGYETIITLSNVLIHSAVTTPIELVTSSSVRMFLAPGSSNEVKSTALSTQESAFPAIKVSNAGGNARLRIKGSGTLVAEGGELSAGIGGNWGGGAGEIRIEDHVTVIARGGMGGAGIGGGETPVDGEATAGGEITISSNAIVIAQGGSGGVCSLDYEVGGAAAIGGGGGSFYNDDIGGAGGTISVSGYARVTALAGEKAAGIGGGENGAGGTISIASSTKVVAVSDGTLPAVHDADSAVSGGGYVMQLDYYNPKTAGTTNTVLRNGKTVTNVVASVAYQSIALSFAAPNTYRIRCNSIDQEHQGSRDFPVTNTGLFVFTAVADTNSLPFTTSTPVPVPYEWLAEYYPSEPEGEYEDLANEDGANGFFVWESYVAGLTPTNAASTFTAAIALTNGTPYITWEPNLEDRNYTVQGKTNLTDSVWGPTNSASRFFNVNVEKP